MRHCARLLHALLRESRVLEPKMDKRGFIFERHAGCKNKSKVFQRPRDAILARGQFFDSEGACLESAIKLEGDR